ncbi:hypothetical protein BGZ65_004426 [Modicella reniformis]|uniref:HTH CENPB-type domain-containing protein n=1 Tax=Modicella reniformis TaxID=1440133 RepID=A0A9P6LSJ0_9FUNG|nr:hypothetical protein BGZ65_004426 [Modicella reniformis]
MELQQEIQRGKLIMQLQQRNQQQESQLIQQNVLQCALQELKQLQDQWHNVMYYQCIQSEPTQPVDDQAINNPTTHQEQYTALSSSSLPGPSSSSKQAQAIQEYRSAAEQRSALTTRRRSREEDEHQIGEDTNKQSKTKQTRNMRTDQQKLEIVDYYEKSQNKSITHISKELNIPRSTTYGIINAKDNLKQKRSKNQLRAGLTLERHSMTESRFHILEELLVTWHLELKSRDVFVTDNKIRTQAFEIHRMLSDLLLDPLLPCIFLSGWLERFKARPHSSLAAIQDANSTTSEECIWPTNQVSGMGANDIYSCTVASMYLNMLPPRVYDGSYQDSPANEMAASKVSVILCCNALGTYKPRPLVLVSHRQNIPAIEGYEETEVKGSTEDFTISTIELWLKEFDSALNNCILLLLDQATFNLFRTVKARSKILIFKVPVVLDSSLPMSVGMVKEFKQNYYYNLLREYKPRGTQAQEPSLEGQLRLIPRAWREVQKCTIRRSFKSFSESIRERQQRGPIPFESPTLEHVLEGLSTLGISGSDELQNNDAHESRLRAVKYAFPDAPDIVVQYYLTQDSDIGPSSLLHAKIQEMKYRQDFGSYFESSNSDQVRYHQTSKISKLFQ